MAIEKSKGAHHSSSIGSQKKNKSTKGKETKKEEVPTEPFSKPGCDFMDQFHENKICVIPLTSPAKMDTFDQYRPPSRTVLDYDIEQTFTKLERMGPDGIQKFQVKQTTATYVNYPPGEAPNKNVKKEKGIRYFTGGPPCCEFLDEIWRRKIEKQQVKAREGLAEFIERRKLRDKEERRKKKLKKLKELERLKQLRNMI